MSNLPPELIVDTLSRIPPKDLIRFMCVSKAYHATIHDRKFINVHQQRAIRTNSFRTLLIEGAEFGLPNAAENDLCSLAFYDNDAFGTIEKLEAPLLTYWATLTVLFASATLNIGAMKAILPYGIHQFKSSRRYPLHGFEQPPDLTLIRTSLLWFQV
ncbi:hypothetical protein PS2_036303 [Malus domestica]